MTQGVFFFAVFGLLRFLVLSLPPSSSPPPPSLLGTGPGVSPFSSFDLRAGCPTSALWAGWSCKHLLFVCLSSLLSLPGSVAFAFAFPLSSFLRFSFSLFFSFFLSLSLSLFLACN